MLSFNTEWQNSVLLVCFCSGVMVRSFLRWCYGEMSNKLIRPIKVVLLGAWHCLTHWCCQCCCRHLANLLLVFFFFFFLLMFIFLACFYILCVVFHLVVCICLCHFATVRVFVEVIAVQQFSKVFDQLAQCQAT